MSKAENAFTINMMIGSSLNDVPQRKWIVRADTPEASIVGNVFLDGVNVTSRIVEALLPNQPNQDAEGWAWLYIRSEDGERILADPNNPDRPLREFVMGMLRWERKP